MPTPPLRPSRRAALLVGLFLVAVTAPVLGIRPAAPGTVRGPGARLSILEQPAWARLGDDVRIRLRLEGPVTGLEVRAIVYAAVTSRTAFLQTTTGERLGSVLDTVSLPAELVAAGAPLVLGIQDPRLAPEAERVRIPLPRGLGAGVFPIEIELRDPARGQRRAVVVTHLSVVAPDGPSVGEPLRVTWIWPVREPPVPGSRPRVPDAFVGSVRDGRLARLAAAAAASAVPLTLEPGPETLERWAQVAGSDPSVAAGLVALRSAARRHQVLTSPYVPLNPVALEAAGLGDELTAGLTLGGEVLARILEQRVDPRISTLEPLDDATLARLRAASVDRLVLAPSALAPPSTPPRLTPARPFVLAGGDHRFAAVVTDPLGRLLQRRGSPSERAARFLAGLAVVALEEPNVARGIVVRMPDAWDPTAADLRAVLDGLRDLPFVRPVPLDALFDGIPPETTRGLPVVRRPARRSPGPVPVTATQLAAARAHLEALRSLVDPDDARLVRAGRVLAVVCYRGWAGPDGRRRARAELGVVRRFVDEVTAAVQPVSRRVVTLTSREADVPVSLTNTGERAVRVRVTLSSDRLLFPDGDDRVIVLPPGKNTTTAFRVETRSSGTFPMWVRVTSADGLLPIREVRYTVRSGAVSGVGVVLTGGAALFVAVWWVTHWRRSRRLRPRTAALA